jgi:hypothetical protein
VNNALSFFLSALTDNDDIILDWQCGVGLLFFFFLFFNVLFSLDLIHFPFFFILTYLHLIVLGDSMIACLFIQRYIVALEFDIDVLKSILLPIREPKQ